MAPQKLKYFSINNGKIIIPELTNASVKVREHVIGTVESKVSKMSFEEVCNKRKQQQDEIDSRYYSSVSSHPNTSQGNIPKIKNKTWLINANERITDDYIIIVPNDKVDEYLTSF